MLRLSASDRELLPPFCFPGRTACSILPDLQNAFAVSARNGFCPVTQGRAFARFLSTGPALLGIPPHRRTAPAASCECRRPARSAAIYGPSPRPGASGGTAFAAVPRPPPSTPCRRVWQPPSPGEGQPHVTKLPLHAAPPPLQLFAHHLHGRARPAENGQRVPVHLRPRPAGVEAAVLKYLSLMVALMPGFAAL